MSQLRGILRTAILVGLSSAAGAQSVSQLPNDWQSALGRQHVLVGKTFKFDRVKAVASDQEELIAQAGNTAAVLIGEMHDNSDHHVLQAWVVRQIMSLREQRGVAERDPAIVLEQFRSDKQETIDAAARSAKSARRDEALPEFKRLTEWEKSGWQQYNYDPLLQSALDLELPLYAGDVPRASMMKVAKEGEGALPADERGRLKLDVPLGPKLDDASLNEIVDAHCNMMPKEAMGGMAYAQRYRDATLADNVLKAAGKHGSAILIAGNGHVRTDRGVPWYIMQRAPDKKVVSIMLVEVEDGKTDPEAYVPRGSDGRPAADYIIFTPRAERKDPCVKMREQMGK